MLSSHSQSHLQTFQRCLLKLNFFLRESMLSVAVQKSQLVESIGLWFFCPTVKLNVTLQTSEAKKESVSWEWTRETEDSVLKGWKRDWASAVSVRLCWAFVRERCWTHHDAGSSCRVPKTDQVQKNHFILFLHYIGFLCVICGCFVGVVVWGMLFFEHC